MDTVDHLHIVCYKWGWKYPAEDVNVLRGMVARNLSVPHTFHCVTDDPARLSDGIVTHHLPDFGFQGIWRKLYTFSDDFLGLNGQYVVGLDLDIVVVRSMDFLAAHPEKPFWIGRNWGKDGRASGAVYRLKVGSHAFIWDRFIADPQAAIRDYHSKDMFTGEQTWLDHNIDEFDFLPADKVVSFKRHCNARGPFRWKSKKFGFDFAVAGPGFAKPPDGAAIVSFHGYPLPRDMLNGPVGLWKRAPFVEKHWRE